MLYVKEIIDHKIGDRTPSKKVADQMGWTLTINEADTEVSYDGSLWEKGYAPQPPEPTIDEQNEAIRQTRQQLYTEQADPLKYDYEECLARYGEGNQKTVDAKNLWLAKKDEIRANNPYPEE